MNTLGNLYKITAFLILILSLPLTAAAYQIPEFVIINAGLGKQFGLRVEGLAQQHAEFTVRSNSGRILLRQRIDSDDYQALYNLEALREGDYLFQLKTLTTEIRQPVHLSKRTIQYSLNERRVVLSPEVQLRGRQLDVDFLNPSQEAFRIQLTMSNGDILYTEIFEGRDEVEKRINLLKIPRGSYRLEMSTPSANWNETIVLN